jgi:hypothetical protein
LQHTEKRDLDRVGQSLNLWRKICPHLHPAALGEPLDIPLRGARETCFVQHWRMEQVRSCTNFLKCLISQPRYTGQLLTYSFAVV